MHALNSTLLVKPPLVWGHGLVNKSVKSYEMYYLSLLQSYTNMWGSQWQLYKESLADIISLQIEIQELPSFYNPLPWIISMQFERFPAPIMPYLITCKRVLVDWQAAAGDTMGQFRKQFVGPWSGILLVLFFVSNELIRADSLMARQLNYRVMCRFSTRSDHSFHVLAKQIL